MLPTSRLWGIQMANRNSSCYLVLFLFLISTGIAVSPALGQRTLNVTSNVQEAIVYADSGRLGTIADGPFQISDVPTRIVVTLDGGTLWTVDPIVFELEQGQDDLKIEALFDYHYRIESIPSGAQVSLDNTVIGQTPISFQRPTALESDLIVTLDGYGVQRITPGSDIWNRTLLELSPQNGLLTGVNESPLRKRKWINYAAVGTSLASGVLAIHLRTKADNRFEDFHETGDNRLKKEIKRLDLQSGISLGVMQVGIGVIAFRIAF